MTVGTLLATASSSELTEWMAFDTIEPFGDDRADMRAGIVAAAAVNHSMSPPKRPKTPLDFMPFVRRRGTGSSGPVKLADPVKHAKLIAQTIFGTLVPKGRRHGRSR